MGMFQSFVHPMLMGTNLVEDAETCDDCGICSRELAHCGTSDVESSTEAVNVKSF
eukprot:NODE_10791_length_199_cov_1008.026667_g9631_i0.p2 GENE.NODE_10791_length_199_cov_1008.026667_g9631_i0~~NODE_10791_length_199_cov_1008.026667_g9631_i0.p2  ORF type:complete len:55 (+),score=7.95 NODE_10791_length_199_cov_1008.026667_g9631_i0:34-198(+)